MTNTGTYRIDLTPAQHRVLSKLGFNIRQDFSGPKGARTYAPTPVPNTGPRSRAKKNDFDLWKAIEKYINAEIRAGKLARRRSRPDFLVFIEESWSF